MKKKILGLVLSLIFVLTVFSGCTTDDGMRLAKALLKTYDYESFESTSSLSVNIDTSESILSKEYEQIINEINSTNFEFISKANIKDYKVDMSYSADMNGLALNGNIYTDGMKYWFKLPGESKYVLYDPMEIITQGKGVTEEEEVAYDQVSEVQQKIRPLAINFVKNYITEYKYAFNNLTNKGIENIKTPVGEKEITIYELQLDTQELIEILKYTLQNAAESKALEEYMKSVTLLMAEENPLMLQGKTVEEVMEDFDTQYEQIKQMLKMAPQQIDMYAPMIEQYFEVGPKGIVFEICVDNNDNIVKTNSIYDLILKFEEEPVNIILNSEAYIYNINNTEVEMPQIPESSMVSATEYFNSDEFYESTLAKQLKIEKPKKYIYLQIDSESAYTNNGVNYLDAAPFIKDDTTLVPVRFIGEYLGAELEWRDQDRAVIFRHENKTIIMNIDKATAYINNQSIELPTAPVIKNGKAMVPLRFIAEELNATVEWNQEYSMITIQK